MAAGGVELNCPPLAVFFVTTAFCGKERCIDMSQTVRETLVDALGSMGGEGIGEYLAECLADNEKAVLDASLPIDGMTRKRGRPRNDSSRDNGGGIGLSRKALLEEKKQKDENARRLSPQPTTEMAQTQQLATMLRQIGWDIDDAPDNDAETARMIRDLDNLRKEAKIRRLDETFAPYAEHRTAWKEYIAEKSRADRLRGQAESLLSQGGHDDEVVDIIASLKTVPRALMEKYQKVLDSYDALCDAICGKVDSALGGKGAESTETTDEEQQGIAPLCGEDFKTYKKRVQKNGLGRCIPKTIEDIDGIVEQAERRWRSVAGLSLTEFSAVKENFRKTFAALTKKCSVGTPHCIADVNALLENRKWGVQARKDADEDDPIARYDGDVLKQYALKCFGVQKPLKSADAIRFGCLLSLSPSKADVWMASQYGRNIIRWKFHEVVPTMAFADSLYLALNAVNYINPCLVSNPSPCCFNPTNQQFVEQLKKGAMTIGLARLCELNGVPYIEVQLHGGVKYGMEAIGSISFGDESDVANLSPKAIETITEMQIPLYLKDKPMLLATDGSIADATDEGQTDGLDQSQQGMV